MTAYWGAENLLESATSVTASNAASTFEGANAYDRRTTSWWKPGVLSSPSTETLTAVFSTTQAVDFFGVIGHNLGTEGATIKLQYSTASPITWITLFTITPTDNKCLFRYVTTPISAADWRIEITNCTADTLLAVAAFGQAVALPEGLKAPFIPPNYGRDKTIMNSMTEGGQFAGRSIISNGNKVNIMQTVVDEAWVDANFDNLMDRLEIAPGFFSWDYENHPEAAAYTWMEKATYPEYTHQGGLYMQFSMTCKALTE